MRKSIPFWERVDKSGDCWLWTGPSYPTGYGQSGSKDGSRNAHRAAWILTFGPIPDKLDVCHRCDVRLCCKPAHLFLGTRADNIHDAMNKNRLATGERHGMHKLTQAEVDRIRADYASSEATQQKLATRYGISIAQVNRILNYGTWA